MSNNIFFERGQMADKPNIYNRIVAELVDAMIKDEVQVFLKNHNKISLATLINMGCWFESNLSYNFT